MKQPLFPGKTLSSKQWKRRNDVVTVRKRQLCTILYFNEPWIWLLRLPLFNSARATREISRLLHGPGSASWERWKKSGLCRRLCFEVKSLEDRIDYKFRNPLLLAEALTHPSVRHEMQQHHFDNQRLEFLGDAVLQLVITEYLFGHFKNEAEGKLTKLRS